MLFPTVLIEDSTACLCSDFICLPIKCPQVCSYTRAGFSSEGLGGGGGVVTSKLSFQNMCWSSGLSPGTPQGRLAPRLLRKRVLGSLVTGRWSPGGG